MFAELFFGRTRVTVHPHARTRTRMQVRIVALQHPSTLLKKCKAMFPKADVDVQKGVDVRKARTEHLLKAGLISHSSAHALKYGRKWHHELSSKGAVGVAQAFRLALEEDSSSPILILEEDCIFMDAARVQRDVGALLTRLDEFDVAAFGVLASQEAVGEKVEFLSKGFYTLHDKFWYMQCVLYSPRGRAQVARHFAQPLDMQVDSLLGSLASAGSLRVLGQVHNWSCMQSVHLSNIQEAKGSCWLCGVQAEESLYAHVVFVAVGTLILLSWVGLERNCTHN